tara:strand:- start:16960 stop:17184 length:225 start_codon:yes stop_codon:yes gene_type:complete
MSKKRSAALFTRYSRRREKRVLWYARGSEGLSNGVANRTTLSTRLPFASFQESEINLDRTVSCLARYKTISQVL